MAMPKLLSGYQQQQSCLFSQQNQFNRRGNALGEMTGDRVFFYSGLAFHYLSTTLMPEAFCLGAAQLSGIPSVLLHPTVIPGERGTGQALGQS